MVSREIDKISKKKKNRCLEIVWKKSLSKRERGKKEWIDKQTSEKSFENKRQIYTVEAGGE